MGFERLFQMLGQIYVSVIRSWGYKKIVFTEEDIQAILGLLKFDKKNNKTATSTKGTNVKHVK